MKTPEDSDGDGDSERDSTSVAFIQIPPRALAEVIVTAIMDNFIITAGEAGEAGDDLITVRAEMIDLVTEVLNDPGPALGFSAPVRGC